MSRFFSAVTKSVVVTCLVTVLGVVPTYAIAGLPSLDGTDPSNINVGGQLPNIPASVPDPSGINTGTQPGLPSANSPDTTPSLDDSSTNQLNNAQPVTNTGSALSISLPANHGLPGSNGVNAVLNTVIGNILSFVALIAIVALVYSGVQLFAAQGKADAIGNAKQNIISIIIGFAIVMLAWSGVNILLRFIGFTR